MVRPGLIDMNLNELKCYPFMISLNTCTGRINVLSLKICVSKDIKDINVKAFNMITNKVDAKATTEHISCDCECKFNSTTSNPKEKWSNKTCKCECKNYCKCKENFSWNLSTCISENSKYLKNVPNALVTKFD